MIEYSLVLSIGDTIACLGRVEQLPLWTLDEALALLETRARLLAEDQAISKKIAIGLALDTLDYSPAAICLAVVIDHD